MDNNNKFTHAYTAISWATKAAAIYIVLNALYFLSTYFYDYDLLDLSSEQKKYVGFHLNLGRLGNQLFHLISGYGIARTMKRTHYLPFEEPRKHVEEYLLRLENVFPDLKKTYFLAKSGIKQEVVKFGGPCFSYDDPMRITNLSNQFLLLDFSFGQNRRYFEDYIEDVRDILQFSEEMKQNGSKIIRSLGNYKDSMCIHVRLTDFISRNTYTDMNSTAKAASTLAKKMNISNFLIFGDDNDFMVKLSQAIVKDGGWRNNAVAISSNEETMDLYLASQMCSSFLISALISTFGWWLAFFVRDQDAVYYINNTRPNTDTAPREYLLYLIGRKSNSKIHIFFLSQPVGGMGVSIQFKTNHGCEGMYHKFCRIKRGVSELDTHKMAVQQT